MDAEKKIAFLQYFLSKKRADPRAEIPKENLLELYAPISTALDWIETNAPEILAPPRSELSKRALLEDIFDRNCTFFIKGSLPKFHKIDPIAIQQRVAFWQRDVALSKLPGCDYYERQTTEVADPALAKLISDSRNHLKPIVERFFPQLNLTDDSAVQLALVSLQDRIDGLDDGDEKTILEKNLTILEDLNKINQLKLISIDQEQGPAQAYCTLAESAGGVTEKVSLIKKGKVEAQLANLLADNTITYDNYLGKRSHFKLGTQAILKLPKHGDVTEVQREALALNVSRILDHETTQSTMVSYKGKPALFVPFDDIRLLKEYAQGKTMQARLFSTAQYSHYSTINPVGEGMHPDLFIDDFGDSLGLFYLCSDTDALGGYNQNKALKGSSLYIFDQVLMSDDKLGLDSRLSMLPIKFMTKHTRHDQGRNRTLIEDSSIESKFDSLIQLRQQQELLVQQFNRTAFIHEQRLLSLQTKLTQTDGTAMRKEVADEIKIVQALKNDAQILSAKVEERIDKINAILPKNPNKLGPEVLKKMFVLEKILNYPALYTDEGRPYRNPWTHRHALRAESIESVKGRPGLLLIKFNSSVPREMVELIKRFNGQDSPAHTADKEITIRADHLQALTETLCSPELSPNLNREYPYLNERDLTLIGKAYGEGHRGRIMNAVATYSRGMQSDIPVNEKLLLTQDLEETLKGYIATAKDKGFGKQVLKRFYFEVQQQLQAMIGNENLPPNIAQAFAAAIKLDQMSLFNGVVREAVREGKAQHLAFHDFLQNCIDKGNLATDHDKAKELSRELGIEADQAIKSIGKYIQPSVLEQVMDLSIQAVEEELFSPKVAKKMASKPVERDELDEIELVVGNPKKQLELEFDEEEDIFARGVIIHREQQQEQQEIDKRDGNSTEITV